METTRNLVESLSKGVGQNGRLLKLDTLLGENVLLPHRVVGQDRLGRGYAYTIDVLSLKQDIELKQLIGQQITLWVQQANPQNYLPINGYVHRAAKLGSDGEFAVYQLTFSSWLEFLKHKKDARLWQDKSADDILKEVFNQHPEGSYRFEIEHPAVERSYCTQLETDFNFIMRLMEEESWYFYFEQQKDGKGHELVITDIVRNLPWMEPKAVQFHQAGSLDDVNKITQWQSSRQLISTKLNTVTFDYKFPRYPKDPVRSISNGHGDIPTQLQVFEYSGAYSYARDKDGERKTDNTVEEWESRAKRFYATSSVRHMAVGHCFDFEGHNDHKNDQPRQCEFVIIDLQWFIENNLPLGTITTDFPNSLKKQIDEIKKQTASYSASQGAAAPRTNANKYSDEYYYGSGFCINHIEVQRSIKEYRSPLEHHKPVMHPQSAIVVGPDKEEIYTDALNRVKIKFIWNRLNPGNEAASCWVRVSYPNAGNDYGALNVPRIGQEVIVTFIDADPDRPIITGRVYNGIQEPQWHSNGKLSGAKSKEYMGSGYNQLVMDDNTNQNRVQLYSSNTHAQLNLGHLVGQKGNERGAFYGSGFALNTDAYGAITANQGLYISTYHKSGATGSQLDINEAHQQLEAGHQLTKALSETAVKAQAEPLEGQDALKQFTDNTKDKYSGRGQEQANRFKEPILLAASPAGIGLTTPESTHIHSGDNITLSSGTDTNLAVGKSLVASIKEKLSLFVFNGGMKLFASKGKVEIQSQSDDLDIIAEKVLRLISATDKIELWAKKEITIGAGGSAIKINEEGITDITTGQRIMHHSAWSLPGPKSLPVELPQMPTTFCEECALNASKGAAFMME